MIYWTWLIAAFAGGIFIGVIGLVAYALLSMASALDDKEGNDHG